MNESNYWSRIQIVTLGVFVFGIFACSTVPILFGSSRLPMVEEIVRGNNDATICRSEPNGEFSLLQLQVTKTKSEIKHLTELANALQAAMNSYESPKCTISEHVENAMKLVIDEQNHLKDRIAKLQELFDSESITNNATITELQITTSKKFVQLQNTFVSLTSEVDNVTALVDNYKTESHFLDTVHNVSFGVHFAVQELNERISAMNNLPEEIAALTVAVNNFTCPEPIAPIVLPPIVVNHTLPAEERTATVIPTAAVANAKNVTRQECVNMTSAHSIVQKLVVLETQLLVKNLTDQLAGSTENAAAALRSAVSDIASNAVEEFLHESTRLHNFDAPQGLRAGDCAAASATATAALDAGAGKTLEDSLRTQAYIQKRREASSETSTPELDYALLSSGSRVLHDRTSRTYFPKGWKLENQVGGALDWVGLPAAVVSGAKDAIAAVSSGEPLFEALNLHKTVGRPEDALVADDQPGACWPMEGSSGNLTVQLAASLVIDSVSIDHAAHIRYV